MFEFLTILDIVVCELEIIPFFYHSMISIVLVLTFQICISRSLYLLRFWLIFTDTIISFRTVISMMSHDFVFNIMTGIFAFVFLTVNSQTSKIWSFSSIGDPLSSPQFLNMDQVQAFANYPALLCIIEILKYYEYWNIMQVTVRGDNMINCFIFLFIHVTC